jgi:small subunit ribosomal protein S2
MVSNFKKENTSGTKSQTPRSTTTGIQVGDICDLNITALATNNVGIDEYTFPFPIFVSGGQYPLSQTLGKARKPVSASSGGPVAQSETGEMQGSGQIKAKIIKKVFPRGEKRPRPVFRRNTGGPALKELTREKTTTDLKARALRARGLRDSFYAVAQLISVDSNLNVGEDLPVKPGDVLTVNITKRSAKGAGIVEYTPEYKIIVPGLAGDSLPKSERVVITRAKRNYAFSTILSRSRSTESYPRVSSKRGGKGVETEKDDVRYAESSSTQNAESFKDVSYNIPVFLQNTGGSPSNFLKYGCKFTTILPENLRRYNNYGILKVRDPIAPEVGSGILFVPLKRNVILGQDRVRIKVRRDIGNSGLNCAIGKIIQINPINKKKKATLVMNSIREMLAHGMHFGEKTGKCHARMKQYIWLQKQGKKKNRPFVKKGQHVINILKTRRCLNKALNTLTKYALKGRTFLFIGTKKPATGLIARASFFTKNSFYVNTRWLGGMLTNWKTICKSISKIRPILKEKQKVVRDILERRQTIKSRFIKRALLLKNKSKLILNKGRQVFQMFKENIGESGNEILSRAKKFSEKRTALITKGMIYIGKRQKLIGKRQQLIEETLFVKERGLKISSKYQMLLNQLAAYTRKLREYKYLLMLSSEMKGLQKSNISLYTVPYGALKNLSETDLKPWIVPNPPKEILNKVALATMRSSETNLPRSPSDIGSRGFNPRFEETHPEDHGNFVRGETGESGTSRVKYSKETTSPAQQTGSLGGNVVVCSSLLLRFARQLNSYIQTVIQNLISSIDSIKTQCNDAYAQLNNIQKTLQTYESLKNQYVTELNQLRMKAIEERHVIQIVKRQFKILDSQKKFLKFLPRLRYLPTPQTKISEIVQILLSKIVDPKLKFPIDSIYDKNLSSSTKKLAAARKKKWQRLEKYFGGIANMTKLSQTKMSKTVAIIIGQKEEMNAVRECNKLGLKTFTIVDTDCDPTLSNHIVPANDDSRNSIKYILTKFITRIRLAQKIRSRFQKYQKI